MSASNLLHFSLLKSMGSLCPFLILSMVNQWKKMEEERDSAANTVQNQPQDQEHPWPYLSEFFFLVVKACLVDCLKNVAYWH